jgi:2-polyprenyl-3-methyl-5-hydroxy-6-metoxy-1,4-benzoquinol methylase
MEFKKYKQKKDYHWRMYDDPNTKYRRHADRVKEWVKEKIVLDIGCGDGKITDMLGAYGIDNDEEGIRLAQEKGVRCEVENAYNTHFDNSQFTSVFMGDVLEHMEFPEKCLQEARRILRDYLYVVTPIPGMQNDPFHYFEPTPEELKDLVEKQGFVLEGEILVVPKDKRMYGKFKKI